MRADEIPDGNHDEVLETRPKHEKARSLPRMFWLIVSTSLTYVVVYNALLEFQASYHFKGYGETEVLISVAAGVLAAFAAFLLVDLVLWKRP